MIIKTPSGKIVAYTIGKSILQMESAKGTLIGTDYSIRLENPENPSDSITVAVEKGEFILENKEKDETKKDGDKSGDEQPPKSQDSGKGDDKQDPPADDKDGKDGKPEDGGDKGDDDKGKGEGGKAGDDNGDKSDDPTNPDQNRKWTKH